MAKKILITCTDSMMKQFLEPHVIHLAENGYIVDPYDVKYFADKITLLLRDKQLRDKMSSYSDKVIDKFQFCNIGKEYIAAIEDSLGN